MPSRLPDVVNAFRDLCVASIPSLVEANIGNTLSYDTPIRELNVSVALTAITIGTANMKGFDIFATIDILLRSDDRSGAMVDLATHAHSIIDHLLTDLPADISPAPANISGDAPEPDGEGVAIIISVTVKI